MLSPEKSTLQFGIGILGKGFNENVEALDPEYAEINAGIKTSWELSPYSPEEFRLFNLDLITSLFSTNLKNVDEFFELSSSTNAVLIAKNDKEKLPPLVGVNET